MTENQQHEAEFDGAVEAQAWIDDAEDGTYCTSHNECGRPTYKIVEI